jgi:hypothetical protein
MSGGSFSFAAILKSLVEEIVAVLRAASTRGSKFCASIVEPIQELNTACRAGDSCRLVGVDSDCPRERRGGVAISVTGPFGFHREAARQPHREPSNSLNLLNKCIFLSIVGFRGRSPH